MKLLFDQNLAPGLVTRLADLYPDSVHVSSVGLAKAPDKAVWTYARDHNCVIVTKDADFSDLGVMGGFPPRILWLRLGNCTTQQIEALLRTRYQTITDWDSDPESGICELR
ncbi:MAG TPA: DUF5615 family PIN-like protein [Chloroflexia bacterium]|nr:DUF5615 family PIN-like protein [Chloroflexia bacterium]